MPGGDVAAVGGASGGTITGVLTQRRRGESYRQVLQRLLVLVRALQATSGDGEPVAGALADLMGPLGELLDAEGALVVGEKDSQLYMNGVRTHVEPELFSVQKFLVQALAGSEMAGLLFE